VRALQHIFLALVHNIWRLDIGVLFLGVLYLGQYILRPDLGVVYHSGCNINKEHPNLSYQATMQRLQDMNYQPCFSVRPSLWLPLSPYHSASAIFATDIET
jgi:hypothetical protein